MDYRNDRKNQNPLGSIISIAIVLLLFSGEALTILGIILLVALVAGSIALPIFLIRNRRHMMSHQKKLSHTSFNPCEQQKAWDERVQDLFCFHKDKSIHHVRRGKEIDPWDRPDIDIRKYQRKQ